MQKMKITKDQLEPKLLKFFNELKSQRGSRAFNLETGEVLKELLAKERLSATSAIVGDLQLVLEDFESKLPSPRRSFSIKSEIGSPATIFNASRSTNLTYKVNSKVELKPFIDISPIKSNLKDLINLGCSFTFLNYDNSNLQKSLENIDSNLPEYLAEVLLGYYLSNTTNLMNICEDTWKSSESKRDLKISKIKKFLSAASMGLRANQIWSGYPEDFGGLLLVKNSGEVLFYYLYNLQKFEEYLFKNLRFETPSANRHLFGQIYQEDNEYKIKLNLQIRF